MIGATGYGGRELIRILSRHPEVEITSLTAKLDNPVSISEVFPYLRGKIDLTCYPFEETADILPRVDVIFLALPHRVSMEIAPDFLAQGKKVIDLSADFRLKEPKVYEAWYKVTHQAHHLLEEAVYGLPELYKEKIKTAWLIANPGCYPTSIILALAPLVREGQDLVELNDIIIDSKTGVSGAGRSPSMTAHFPEINEDMLAYKVAGHQHTPEIEQELSNLAGRAINITFTPHLIPITAGILSTGYLRLQKNNSWEEVSLLYQDFYSGQPFIRLLPEGTYPRVKNVVGTNYCEIGWQIDKRTSRLIVLSAIDNLIKGASGQAVQNMNLMFGFDEETGFK
ncbi:MAG: N-acetyl-gamma-glutamyl-phosphate reductase [bacterium]